jgi:hypothetical protein
MAADGPPRPNYDQTLTRISTGAIVPPRRHQEDVIFLLEKDEPPRVGGGSWSDRNVKKRLCDHPLPVVQPSTDDDCSLEVTKQGQHVATILTLLSLFSEYYGGR